MNAFVEYTPKPTIEEISSRRHLMTFCIYKWIYLQMLNQFGGNASKIIRESN